MSTDLYRVRVLAVAPEQRRVRLRVVVAYYDEPDRLHEPLPDDKSFFLRVFYDTTFGVYDAGRTAFAEELPEQFDFHRAEGAVESNAYRYIERFERLATRNYPLTDWESFRSDGDEDELVQADYDVFVTDAKYIRHLTPGMRWGSTAYPTRADGLSLDEAPGLPDLRLERCRLAPFSGPEARGTASQMAFSDDGRYLAVVSEARELVVYEVGSWGERLRREGFNCFSSLQFWPAAPVIQANDDYRREYAAWDIEAGREQAPRRLPGLVRSRSGRLRADWGERSALTLLGADGRSPREILTEYESLEGAAVAFTPDERLVALSHGHDQAGRVWMWSVETGAPARALELGAPTHDLAFSPSGDYLAAALVNAEAAVMRVRDGEIVRRGRHVDRRYLSATDTYAVSVAYSPEGRLLAVRHINAKEGYGGHVAIHEVGARWPFAPAREARP
jgi:hypothetical protein